MKDQKHNICFMILPEGIREDLDEGLKALSEKHAKDKRMATVEERTVAAAQILKSKTNAAVSFELVERTTAQVGESPCEMITIIASNTICSQPYIRKPSRN